MTNVIYATFNKRKFVRELTQSERLLELQAEGAAIIQTIRELIAHMQALENNLQCLTNAYVNVCEDIYRELSSQQSTHENNL